MKGQTRTRVGQPVHEWHCPLSLLAEVSRVYLRHLEDVENSDYINACYVDVSHYFIEGGRITQCIIYYTFHPFLSSYSLSILGKLSGEEKLNVNFHLSLGISWQKLLHRHTDSSEKNHQRLLEDDYSTQFLDNCYVEPIK